MISSANLARFVARSPASFGKLAHIAAPRSLAYFSSESSHDDFAPIRKVNIETEDDALKMIAEHIRVNPIMLYMKGTPSSPMCGFSARVTQVLESHDVDFASVDVLNYPQIREGVKKFSDWPTIPQLYVKGEFIGGCDIVMSMHESGELSELFKDLKTNTEESTTHQP